MCFFNVLIFPTTTTSATTTTPVTATTTGEILVYDLSHTEEVTPLAVGECAGGGVTTLAWVELGDVRGGDGAPPRAPHTLTATTSTGQILVWSLSLTKQQLTLKAG